MHVTNQAQFIYGKRQEKRTKVNTRNENTKQNYKTETKNKTKQNKTNQTQLTQTIICQYLMVRDKKQILKNSAFLSFHRLYTILMC